jgi:hypothetical protein
VPGNINTIMAVLYVKNGILYEDRKMSNLKRTDKWHVHKKKTDISY